MKFFSQLFRPFSTRRTTVQKRRVIQKYDVNVEASVSQSIKKRGLEVIDLPENLLVTKHQILPDLSSSLTEAEKKFYPQIPPGIVTKVYLPSSRKDILQSPVALIEDRNTIIAALKRGAELKILLYSNAALLEDIPYTCPKAWYIHTTDDIIKKYSHMEHPTGLIGVFLKPSFEELQSKRAAENRFVLPITLICDRIQNPANLTSILQTASCFGIHSAYLLKGTQSPWTNKVINEAGAAQFVLPMLYRCNWSELSEHIGPINRVFAAQNKVHHSLFSSAIPYYDAQFWSDESHCKDSVAFDSSCSNDNKVALIVGNENDGISEEGQSWLNANKGISVNIPRMQPLMDSLNASVAIGILLGEAQRQYFARHFPAKKSVTSTSRSELIENRNPENHNADRNEENVVVQEHEIIMDQIDKTPNMP